MKKQIIRNFWKAGVALTAVLFMSCKGTGYPPSTMGDVLKGIEFEMTEPEEPVIPDYSVKITDFGATSGGQFLNSRAFEDAIDAVSRKGGGRVIIPAGIWLTGPIKLKSSLELHAEAGALIVFSDDKKLYPLVETSFEGVNTWRCISPLYGKDLENIAFTGSGVWDGSGDSWRYVKKSKLTEAQWKKLLSSGGVLNEAGNEWYPSEQFRKAHSEADMNVPSGLRTREEFEAIRDFLRPVMVSIVKCRKVLFDGPTFQNSPAWCIHPLMVEHLTVRNITVRNPWYSQNGDGIDLESCRNAVVCHSNFDVGDDAICIKSGKNRAGRERGIPCENIIIKNCIVFHGHGGVTIGSEMSGGVKNIHVSNCSFMGTDVGLRFKSARGRGGVVENIYMSRIRMMGIQSHAISFDLFYEGKSVGEIIEEMDPEKTASTVAVTEETPVFRSIKFLDIACKGAGKALFLRGLPEMYPENIHLENLVVEADQGMTFENAGKVTLQNLSLVTKKLPAIEFVDCRNIIAGNLNFPGLKDIIIKISGKLTRNIVLKEIGDYTGQQVLIGEEVPVNEVKK